MGKFYLLFLGTLCIYQNLGTTIATTPEEQSSINNIVKIVEEITTEIKQIVEDLSKRLPVVIKSLETKIKDVVGNVNIANIFETTREEIEEIIQDPSISSECAENAEEELDELNKSTTSGLNNCVLLAQGKTKDIQIAVQELMVKASQLAQEMTKKINKCGDNFGTDAIGLSQCLTEEINEIKNMLGQLKSTVQDSMDVAENIASEVGIDAAECLKEVRNDAEANTEEVISRLKNCNTHGEL